MRTLFLILAILAALPLWGQYYGQFRYVPAAGGGGTPMSKCDWVDESDEDDEEASDGTRSGSVGDIMSSDLELGNDGSVLQNIGMYFDSLNIPATATIDSVFIQFTVDNTSISDPCSVRIYCQEGSTPAKFSEVTNGILGRDWTEAFTTWTLTGGSWSPVGNSGADQRTPNFATALQETIDNPSYSQGDPIVVIIEGVQGEREAESFDGSGGPPYICVYWTE